MVEIGIGIAVPLFVVLVPHAAHPLLRRPRPLCVRVRGSRGRLRARRMAKRPDRARSRAAPHLVPRGRAADAFHQSGKCPSGRIGHRHDCGTDDPGGDRALSARNRQSLVEPGKSDALAQRRAQGNRSPHQEQLPDRRRADPAPGPKGAVSRREAGAGRSGGSRTRGLARVRPACAAKRGSRQRSPRRSPSRAVQSDPARPHQRRSAARMRSRET